uniref:SET domain-containing protein n=1 Tax=Acrobeloides nanus TaxID=290746 RepID=A0A914D5I2_9BILA
MEKSLIGIKADVTVENVDDFIVCEECGIDFVYMCKKHPFLLAEDNMMSLPNYEEAEPTPEIAAQLGSTVAELTCPDYCVIKESKILNAGLGVFANIGLPTGICFGPYKGEISENKKMANKSGYAWEIRPRPGEQTRFIDGADPNKSNWLRYINGASVGESQNLHAFQYRGQVFYEVFRPIEKGEELLGKFLFFIFST